MIKPHEAAPAAMVQIAAGADDQQPQGFSTPEVSADASVAESAAAIKRAAPIVTADELDYRRAHAAYANISMTPDVRARQEQQAFVQEIEGLYAEVLPLATTDALHDLLLGEVAAYKAGYLHRLYAVLDAKSRTASSMITGPSNFPTARNQQRLASEHKRTTELHEWRDKVRAAIRKRVLDAQPLDQRVAAEWHKIQRKIAGNLATIEAIDAGTSPYHRPAFVNSITGLVERLANHGRVELVERAIGLVHQYNETHTKPAISKRHTFWTYADVARSHAQQIAAVASTEPTTIATFDGGRIVSNPELNRIQIFFDAKPGEQMRAALRGAGWKWSPTNNAWQRQRTPAAIASAKQLCGIKHEAGH